MYRLHSYIQGLKAEELRQESLLLHRDIKRMAKYLEVPDDSTYMVPSVSPGAVPDKDNGKRHFEDHNILGESSLMISLIFSNREDRIYIFKIRVSFVFKRDVIRMIGTELRMVSELLIKCQD